MADDVPPSAATEKPAPSWRGPMLHGLLPHGLLPPGMNWRERLRSRSWLGTGYALAALLTAVAVWMASSAPVTGPVGPRSQAILIVLGLNLVLIIALASAVGWRFFRLIVAQRRDAGARLHLRFVLLFAAAASAPAIVVALVFGVLVTQGVDSWFEQRVRTVVENSVTVAKSWLSSQTNTIHDDVQLMVTDLNRAAPEFQQSPINFSHFLALQASYRNFPAAYLIDHDGRILARAEVDARHPELDDAERAQIANAIGVGALRYFMLRFTRNTVIAFDFRDALSFEGETGPYAQYAAVRAANIFRKGDAVEAVVLSEFQALDASVLAPLLEGEDGTSVWEVWLAASRVSLVLEQAIAAAEPAVLAKYAFTLAQSFNNFYHRHRVLTESDPVRKTLLFATAAVARREITRVLGWLGISVPSAM